MPSHFDQLNEVHAAPNFDHLFGEAVILVRGSDQTAQFTAPWEDQEYQLTGMDGFETVVKSRDFVLEKSKLVLNSVEVEPRRGDIIRVVETSQDYALLTTKDRPAVEPMEGGYRFLVHTKRVE